MKTYPLLTPTRPPSPLPMHAASAGPSSPVYDLFLTHYAPPGPLPDQHPGRLVAGAAAAELQPRGPMQPPARFPDSNSSSGAQREEGQIVRGGASRVLEFRLGTCHPDLSTSVRANVEVATHGSREQTARAVEQFCKSLAEYVEDEYINDLAAS